MQRVIEELYKALAHLERAANKLVLLVGKDHIGLTDTIYAAGYIKGALKHLTEETLLSKHADLFSTVKALDNGGLTMDRYTILIEDDLWFMSSYPAYANGVCMYGGQCSNDYENVHLGEPLPLDQLPITVLKQIVVLAKEAKCLSQ